MSAFSITLRLIIIVVLGIICVFEFSKANEGMHELTNKVLRPAYLGCYKNVVMHSTRVKYNSARQCIRICTAENFKYAAIQNGGLCYCRESFIKYTVADESQCNLACADLHEKDPCGGKWTSSVYQLPVQNPMYLGCYKNALKYSTSVKYNSAWQCIRICTAENFKYAAIQNGGLCYCRESFIKHTLVDESQCNLACADPNEKAPCGGKLTHSVYKLPEKK